MTVTAVDQAGDLISLITPPSSSIHHTALDATHTISRYASWLQLGSVSAYGYHTSEPSSVAACGSENRRSPRHATSRHHKQQGCFPFRLAELARQATPEDCLQAEREMRLFCPFVHPAGVPCCALGGDECRGAVCQALL